ncbi:MAG: SH3 domain-containing protein, partial [Candidatus Andersenbacteria bacterium]
NLSIGDNGDTLALDSNDWDISATGVITGASFDANGSGNSITNIETGDVANGTLDADDLDYATEDGAAADGECLKFEDSGGGDFKWDTCGGGSGSLDDAYNNGATITVDAADVLFDLNDATNDYGLVIDNNTAGAIAIGLEFTSGGGGALTTAIDASATAIGTALAIGENAITTAATSLASTELDLLNDGIALSELTDSGTLTATTVDINGGAVDGTAIGANTASSGAFTTLTSTGVTTIGNNSATVAVNSNDWDISTAGALTGISLDANGSGNSLSNVENADLAANTLDWDRIADATALDAATSITGTAGEVFSVVRTLTDATTENAMTVTATAADTSAGTTSQFGLYLDNAASSEGLDASLVIDNSDLDDAVGAAIKFIDAGGTFTNLFDVAGTLLSSSEVTLLNDGITLGELTDSGTFTATTVDINGGAIDGTAIGASSASTAAFTTLASTGATTIGNNTATVAIDSNDWDISATGAITGISLDATGTGNSVSNLDFTHFQDTMDLDANLVLNQTTNTWSQTFTGDTTTGLTYTADSLTSGTALAITSGASAFTGSLGSFTLSGSNAANTGTVLKIANTGALNLGKALFIDNDAVASIALDIDAENTTADVINVDATTLTTGRALDVFSDGLTTGRLARFYSNSSSNSSRNLVEIINDNTAATGAAALSIQQDAAEDGLFIDHNANGQALDIEASTTNTTAIQITAAGISSGKAMEFTSLTGLTSGNGLYLTSTGSVITSGELITANLATSAASPANKTGNLASIAGSRTKSGTSGTTSDDYDLLGLTRTSIKTGTGGILDAQGSVLRIENVATPTGTTLTDGVRLLEMVQDADSTGDAIFIDNNTTATALSLNIDHAGTQDIIDVMAENTAFSNDMMTLSANEEDTGAFNFLKLVSDVDGTPDTELTIDQDGTITTDGDVSLADLIISGGNINPSAALTIGDNGDTLALDSNDWDIDATGTITGASFDANGSGNSVTNIETADIANGTLDADDLDFATEDDAAADGECLKFETSGGGDFLWGSCSAGGTTWDAIGDAAGNGAVAFGTTEQTMDWDFTTTAHDGMIFNFDNNGGTAGTDNGVVINNAVSTNAASDLNTESLLLIQQLDTTASGTTVVDNGLKIDVAANSGMTDGIEITNSAGNLTNGINIVDTAGGTITTGIVLSGTFTNLIDAANFDVTNAGNVDAGGTLTAGSSNIAVTDSTGHVQHDSIVDCADGQILKWATGGGEWGCASDATGSGPTTKYLNTQHNISSTTATEVTGISTTLTAGTYVFKYSLIVQSAATGTGIGFGINYTGTATKLVATEYYLGTGTAASTGTLDDAATGIASEQIIEGSAARTETTTAPNMNVITGVAAANVDNYVTIEGVIVVSDGGDLELWHNSDTAAQSSVMTGSTLVVTQITQGADLAEIYGTKDDSIRAGQVVSLDPSMRAGVKKSETPYDPTAFGIISTSPGMVTGSLVDPEAMPVLVALAGRVPVKVTTENGPIQAGDLLTSSSTPGVAMRATKAGQVIGQAMTDFAGEGVGSIMAFIKTDYAPGGTLADLVRGLDHDGEPENDLGRLALTQLISQKEALGTPVDISDITTDRLMAGLAVITPSVITQELTVDSMHAVDREVTLNLSEDGTFIVKNETGEAVVTIDDFGDAAFAGTLTAERIVAGTIEGMEIVTEKINSLVTAQADLSQRVAGLTDQVAQAAVLAAPTVVADPAAEGITITPSPEPLDRAQLEPSPTATPLPSPEIVAFKEMQFESGEILDAQVLGTLAISGTLTVDGGAEFSSDVFFSALAEFGGNVRFEKDVTFTGRPVFNNDTAGMAKVNAGGRRVDVVFTEAYATLPIVNATFTFDQIHRDDGTIVNPEEQEERILAAGYTYLISRRTVSGFTIVLNKLAEEDLTFSWVALAVNEAKTFESAEVVVPASISETESEVEASATAASEPAATSEDVVSVPQKAVMVIPNEAGYVRLREAATVETAELAQIPIGTALPYTSVENNWYAVTYDGKQGWVSGDYVTLQ